MASIVQPSTKPLMSIVANTECSKCILSLQVQLINHGLDSRSLSLFLKDAVDSTREFINVSQHLMSTTELVRRRTQLYEAELLLSLLRRSQPTR